MPMRDRGAQKATRHMGRMGVEDSVILPPQTPQ
jgi:hypothetical protein